MGMSSKSIPGVHTNLWNWTTFNPGKTDFSINQTLFLLIGRQECHHECLKVAESVCQYWVWTNVEDLLYPFKCVLFSDYDQEHSNPQKIFGPRECKIGGLCSLLLDNYLNRFTSLAKKWPL